MRIIVFFDLPVTTVAKRKAANRLCANLPQEGSIRCLEVTEKQFATMKLLLGELKTQEKKVNSDQLLLF